MVTELIMIQYCNITVWQVIHLLLEGKADINIKDSTNRTPLHYATLANRPDVVNLCIESGKFKSLMAAWMIYAVFFSFLFKKKGGGYILTGNDFVVILYHIWYTFDAPGACDDKPWFNDACGSKFPWLQRRFTSV